MKKIFIYSSLTLVFLGVFYFLFSYRFWPFSTGTNMPVFLGLTFEMSVPEVRRVLKKRGIQLLDAESFKQAHPDISKDSIYFLNFEPVLVEDSPRIEYWYMPPLEMFHSYVFAQFSFENDKLFDVDLEIHPFRDLLSNEGTVRDAEKVVEKITSKLKTRYTFSKKKSSTEIPGAYTLLFEGKNSHVNFWVNLSEQSNPIISLSICYIPQKEKREVEIKKRETVAF
jgi:hypothetical protein